MGNCDDAVCDLKVSLCTEQSLSGKRQIEGELKLIVVQHNGIDFPPYVANYKDSVTNGIIFTFINYISHQSSLVIYVVRPISYPFLCLGTHYMVFEEVKILKWVLFT